MHRRLRLLDQARTLSARLEKLPPDSIWARRASGARGNLLKWLDRLADDKVLAPDEISRLEQVLCYGYWLLGKAARELIE